MKIDDFQSPFGSTHVMKSVIFIKNHGISKKKKTANIEYYWGRVAKVGGHETFQAGLGLAEPVRWEGKGRETLPRFWGFKGFEN